MATAGCSRAVPYGHAYIDTTVVTTIVTSSNSGNSSNSSNSNSNSNNNNTRVEQQLATKADQETFK
ncbi:hypothetical protein E4U53_007627 [Claviceps sorghi]|nr:hypothetical protein E4U53_007627 [Claviceps sorghi]